jgi:hypothetical protein
VKDLSLAASLKESVAFNDIARWNKIFVKWGSVRYHHQSQATRYKELKIKPYLSCHSFGYPRSMSYISSTQSKEA